jgi:hypothetical protein
VEPGQFLHAGDAGGLGLTTLEKTITLGMPFPTIESPLLVTPGFVGTLTNAPAGADIPGELFEGYIQARWLKKIGDRFGADLAVLAPAERARFVELCAEVLAAVT